MNSDLDFLRLVGRREAFTLVAARCSAEDAKVLREVRNSKLYLGHADDWGECCTKYFNISRESANRIIHYLEEFGPAYFLVSQMTRVSPDTYRKLAPSIRDQTLHHNGEAIALIMENAEKITTAVAEIRKQSSPKPLPAPKASAVERLDRRCRELVEEIRSVVAERPQAARLVLYGLRQRIDALERTM